ncbi:MAG TPA: acyl carrier protein, partial [Clostridiales bacterium]|nr:acyl carrier protein [Clostridiales bacterium]
MFEQVKRIFIEELGLHSEDVTPEANLRNGLGISSLEFLNVII